MTGEPLHELSIADAGALLRAGKLTSRSLTEHALGLIDALDSLFAGGGA